MTNIYLSIQYGHMKEYLKQLGFSDTEAVVYLYVVERGRVTPAHISRDTGIKRPTVYAATNELVTKGVLFEDIGGRSKYFMANPKDLEKLVVAQKKKILTDESLISQIMPELLEKASTADTPIPRVRYIRDEDLKDFFYTQSPVWDQSMLERREMSWWGHNSADLTQYPIYREWIDWYWKRVPRGIEVHLLSPEHDGEHKMVQDKYPRRHIHFWDEEHDASQWIVGDYVILVVTKHTPHYAIEIYDRLMADSLRKTYRKLWQLMDE